jgi:23S rRNA-/tRNA-specific pseudouridylate synthase
LDRDTAGLILVAKNQKTFDELQKLFKEQKVVKKYEALVWGEVDLGDEPEIIVNEKITRHKKDPRIWTCGFTSSEGGRHTGVDATTIVKKIKYFSEKNWTLLSLTPKTGRTHQLRLHCRFLGHPIVGDDKYGLNGKINEHSIRQIEKILSEENVENDKKEKLKLVAKSLEFELHEERYSFESSFIL